MKQSRWLVAALVLIAIVIAVLLAWHGQSPVRRWFESPPDVTLLVTTDVACDWKLDGNPQGRLAAKGSSIVPSAIGQHLLEAKTVDGQDSWKTILEFREPEQYVAAIPLLSVRQKRLGTDPASANDVTPDLPALANPAMAPPSPPALKSISGQIDQVISSGRYTNLPQPQSAGGSVVGGESELSIENRTGYELTVSVAGSVEKSISVQPGATRTMEVPPGSYRILGRVNASNILPFIGTHSYSSGVSYTLPFYIQYR